MILSQYPLLALRNFILIDGKLYRMRDDSLKLLSTEIVRFNGERYPACLIAWLLIYRFYPDETVLQLGKALVPENLYLKPPGLNRYRIFTRADGSFDVLGQRYETEEAAKLALDELTLAYLKSYKYAKPVTILWPSVAVSKTQPLVVDGAVAESVAVHVSDDWKLRRDDLVKGRKRRFDPYSQMTVAY